MSFPDTLAQNFVALLLAVDINREIVDEFENLLNEYANVRRSSGQNTSKRTAQIWRDNLIKGAVDLTSGKSA